MLTPEQTKAIKKQLIKQIEKSFPEDKKDFAIQQIESMDSNELEEFLKKNNLIPSDLQKTEQCIFCSIVKGEIDSYKIDENKDSIAVLEINPISRGHVLIIPKEHSGRETKKLAEEVSGAIEKKLKPREIKTENANLFGHEVANIIPVYGGEKLGKRRAAKPEELQELQKILEKQTKEKTEKEKPKAAKPKRITLDSRKIWLPKRIP